MPATAKNVAVLGATGSIGQSALEVIAASSGRLRAFSVSGHTRLDLLSQAARDHGSRTVIATNRELADAHRWSGLPGGIRRLTGPEGLEAAVADPAVDVVLAAIVGAAGLQSTLAALEAGKVVALANKETLVMAGPIIQDVLQQKGGSLIPVDSEHSAVFQAMQGAKAKEVRRVVLTASGGPFRTWPVSQLSQITVSEALIHPTWQMGPKITVDSATMMNKALEIIEARWLFNLSAEQIEVVIHPQSIVHSFVEFVDGSVLAQMSPPDMKLPIQYALEYPDRLPGPAERIDWSERMTLEFEPPDPERFPAIALGHQCARTGGTSGAVLNAANEAAVQAFLDGDLHFTEIVPACRSVLESHNFEPRPSLSRLIELDAWARQEMNTWMLA
ncbi:1-deoxy-D-xylulose 5-phosphate reductoisomerase [Posidoniimonas polymericola]|uniref:1-deoxy-D-xylulose 5-phosphate reductoisomerase n=1 Tax=Posidoniimonas polymericola TaxID=2528002 RepID=A0A5C5YU77_9BACT|nr:1-deoxy-D-xylulose-5-phosphate reductoisomerase [Posidoniimonas polymericola]TWT78569.1 1-deoxy-D-xylulose 5-phosphate reductoisomerase [Posidoniimonas polymericola]